MKDVELIVVGVIAGLLVFGITRKLEKMEKKPEKDELHSRIVAALRPVQRQARLAMVAGGVRA